MKGVSVDFSSTIPLAQASSKYVHAAIESMLSLRVPGVRIGIDTAPGLRSDRPSLLTRPDGRLCRYICVLVTK